jgi:WD40 repeat protein
MNCRMLSLAIAVTFAGSVLAQEKNDVKPLLRLEAGGPTSNVTAVAFSPDGKTLYAAGFDKVVRGWIWNDAKKLFELDDALAFRVPIGPGLDGAINAIAISDDGKWLAVGGFGVVGEGMKFNEAGRIIPTKGGLTAAMREERGQISVFNVRDRSVKTLRGHSGPALSLAFAQNAKDPMLLSAAEGWDSQTNKANGEAKVWDVVNEKAIGSRTMTPLTFARRPGLALLDTGAGKLQAFLAWEDGTLLRWNPADGSTVNLPGPKMNVGLALDGTRGLAMTGIEGTTGVLKIADLDASGVRNSTIRIPSPAANEFELPLAVRFGGKGGYTLSVVRRFQNGLPASDALWIVRNNLGKLDAVVAKLPLGEGNRIVPTLTASDTHIAVGGFPDHRVLIFDINDAIKNGATLQTLRSAGVTMRSVAFAKKGDERGLTLSEKADANGDLAFDISTGKLLPNAAGWVSDAAPIGDYRVVVAGLKATLLKGAQQVSASSIREGAITATAVLPPLEGDVPLVALASYIPTKGTTLLELANGSTGQILRRFTGHTAPIRSLSFRADGKLLASAADDQTTVVWSLTDLGEVLGKHGSLGDLAAETRGKDLVVIDAANVAGVNVGDVVRGFYDKAGKLRTFATPAAFYEGLWLKKPGQNVKLRISTAGQERDVEVPVQQGVDVRKPLFSLFFPRDAAGKLGDWLGWNAIGPYDSSRRDVEQYLGWHFNTGRPERPTSFAFIDQYRKEYFRPGLLKEMADLGDLPPPPKPPAPKPVLLVPGVAEEGNLLTRVGGEYLVRNKGVELHVTIPAYEPYAGDELTYQLDGGPARPLEPTDVNLWSAKLDVPPGAAATRNVVIRMKRTPEGWPVQEQRLDLALRIAAAPPKITLENPKDNEPIKVEKPAFAIKVRVQATDAGVPFQAFIAQEAQGKKIVSREVAKTAEDTVVDLAMTLQPGLNLIRVRAVNDRAIDRDNERQEEATTTLKVTYVERKVPPPEFVFQSIVPAGSADKIPITGRSVKVETAKATLYGQILSQDPLTAADWDLAGAKKALEGVNLQKPGEFKVELDLKPGKQRVQFLAKSASNPDVIATQEIDFRPKLPELVLVSPEAGFTVSGEGEKAEVPLEARWNVDPARETYPVTLEAEVFAKGKSIGREEANVNLAAGQVRFPKLPIAPGDNEIRIRMRHAFGGDDRVELVQGRFIRPPRILGLTNSAVQKAPFVDVIAEVASALPPVAESVRVTVNGQPIHASKIEIVKGKDDRSWQVVAHKVPVAAQKGKEMKSDITLALATADGQASAALKEPVLFALPLPPAPEVTLLEPALRDATVSDPVTKIRFKVGSEAPLTRVDLLRGDKVLKQWDDIPAAIDGVHEFVLPDVALEWGLNSLRILAWNEGGVRTSALNINVPPQPVRLDLEHVEIAQAGLKIRPGTDGGFAPLPVGRVVLHGNVRWNSFDDANLQKAKQVRMFVNGFQQLPVEMKTAAGQARERKFEVPVVLNFASNDIEIDLPDLKQDAANRRRLSVACRQPVRGQHLHVLVIAPQETDEAKLVANLARGIKAQPIGANLYKTPVFDVVRVYVLAKHVQLLEISSRLDRIAESLRERARAGSPNDLVMIYFQGKETVGAQGPILWTSESAPWLQLTLKDLAKNYLSRFSGGQVLILDTISKAGDIEFRDVRFAYLRRPDPRPLMDASRPRLSADLEKEMPRVVWLDQLTTLLAAQASPNFQSYLPDTLRNKIQLNPN